MSRSVLPQHLKDGRFFQEVGGACLKPSFFHSAMPTERRETAVQIENGIFAWCKSMGVACFYKTQPSDLKSFELFFASFRDKKSKEKFLIDHGLAVASAASFFFENAVQSENGGVSKDCVMQLLAINALCHDQVSSHDIKYFPYLRDASTYSCSGLFGDRETINWFNDLDNNKIFCEKSYAIFLKIILTPDDFIQKIFKDSVPNEFAATNVSLHFICRRDFLKQHLKNNEKFKAWWEQLSASDIQLLLSEFSFGGDLQKSKALLQLFSQEMAIKAADLKIEHCFSLLTQLIDLSVDEVLLENQFSHAIGLYVPLVSLKEVLSHLCQPFFQETELSSDSIAQFIRKITNLLNGFESLSFVVDRDKNVKLNAFLHETRDAIQNLQKSLIDSKDEFEKIDPLEQSDAIEFATQLAPANFVHVFMQWLAKQDDVKKGHLENARLISNFFKKTYGAYQVNQTTYVAEAASALFSAASFASSWVSSKISSAPVFRAVTPRHDLDHFTDKINALNNFDALTQVMSELLSLQGNEIESVHKQFVSGLMKQFVSEFMAKQFVMKMQYSPYMSRDLMRFLIVPVSDAEVMGAVNLFIKRMQPESLPCFGASEEWVSVEHTSEGPSDAKPATVSSELFLGRVVAEESDHVFEEGDHVFAELTNMQPFSQKELEEEARGFNAHAV